MSKKRKDRENLDPSPRDLPQTFRELSLLTNPEVNALLRQFSLPVKGKRNHRLTLLAQHLHIHTDGFKGDQDPFLQTLTDVRDLKDGWTGDIRLVPEIRLDSILRYLQASHDISDREGDFENYTCKSLKSYKALRAYDMWESGHISSFAFNELSNIEGLCALKCLANPSGDTSGTQYNVIVILKEYGEPIGALCTCVAGLGEACTHIAGLMFGVEDFVSRGYKELPDCYSTTEKLCKWNVPKGPKAIPTQLKKMSVSKNIPGRPKKEKPFRASNFNPVPIEKRIVNFESLKELHHNLSLVAPDLPWVRAVAPAIIDQERPEHMKQNHQINTVTTMPELLNGDHPSIVPSHLCEVKTNTDPLTLKEKLKIETARPVTMVSYTFAEKRKIELLTQKQSNSAHWHKYRLGLITASNFQRVVSHKKVIDTKGRRTEATDNIVQTLINGNKFKGNTATRYGQMHESVAVEAYRQEMVNLNHNDFQVVDCGLIISNTYDYLGASPDRIVKCKCHGKRLLEVKCPFTLTDKTRTISSLDFLQPSETGLTLKTNSNTYYAQIQGQMGVTGIHFSDLVVWDGNQIEIVPVKFDESYWFTLADKLMDFHRQYVFPALSESVNSTENMSNVLNERRNAQIDVSDMTKMYPCGKCGKLLKENVKCDTEASINCECECKCQQWFHWTCVNFRPDPDLLDEEPPWFCPRCVRNCDIVM